MKNLTIATPVWDIIGNVRDLTLNLETGEADVSTRANMLTFPNAESLRLNADLGFCW